MEQPVINERRASLLVAEEGAEALSYLCLACEKGGLLFYDLAKRRVVYHARGFSMGPWVLMDECVAWLGACHSKRAEAN
jgi:hypothetical protein